MRGNEFTSDNWQINSKNEVVPSDNDAEGTAFDALTDAQKSEAGLWLRQLVKERYTIIGYNGLY
jgi:hypothetical protein